MEKIDTTKHKPCKYLKAKNPYGLMEGGDHPWYLLDRANTICWCVRSGGGAGPDDGLVEPARCVSGRACYVPPEK